ncbi:TIGR03943 family putative permease subunit [Gorillibacterium timonense]|uniref:TIGR03943 family putative permease subunit n=1 Tax=Gorillibacterium timonense TaxID=1689269 RepID=UPI00071C615B|nr:TIGR03943 family protein [Gorillibacterium timonense]
MNDTRRESLHYLARAAILMGLSAYIAYLVQIGKLSYYIIPRLEQQVKYAGVALFIIGAFQAYFGLFGKPKEGACGCCTHAPSRSLLRNVVTYGLFVLPLSLGLLLPDSVMGASVAAVKGMNLNANVLAVKKAKLLAESAPSKEPVSRASAAVPSAESWSSTDEEGRAAFESPDADGENAASTGSLPTASPGEGDITPPNGSLPEAQSTGDDPFATTDPYMEDYARLGRKLAAHSLVDVKETGFMEILGALDLFKEPFLGKKIRLSGFVYREKDMGEGSFVVSRLAMQCCSADAAPYGLLVRSSMSTTYQKDDWVTVTGTIESSTYQGQEIITVKAESISRIQAPDSPYVYPYMGDFAELSGSGN